MSKKKICLVTSEESFGNNFGAALQGFALYKYLNDMFGDCRILHYDSIKSNTIQESKMFAIEKIHPSRIYKYVKRKNYYKKYKEGILQRNEKFLEFQDNFKFVDNIRYSINNIKLLNSSFDVLVCGSDQIWNPIYKGYKNDPIYFLSFGDSSLKRIAYAPSIGITNFPESCKEDFKAYIQNLDFLSIREKTGQKIINEIIGCEVPVLPDPTFLLASEEWDNIAKETEEVNYILLYRFIESDYLDDIIGQILSKYKYKVITVPMYYNEKDNKYERKFDVGPSEFLGLIKNASLVCAESFHATVFSIIFGVPFLTFARKDLKKDGDSRISDLLSVFGLQHRMCSSEFDIDVEAILNNQDVISSKKFLNELRKTGTNYLNEAFYDKNC